MGRGWGRESECACVPAAGRAHICWRLLHCVRTLSLSAPRQTEFLVNVCSCSPRVCAAFLPFGVQHVLAKAIEVPGLPGLALPALDVHYDFVRCPGFSFLGRAGGRGSSRFDMLHAFGPPHSMGCSSARVVVPSCMLTSVCTCPHPAPPPPPPFLVAAHSDRCVPCAWWGRSFKPHPAPLLPQDVSDTQGALSFRLLRMGCALSPIRGRAVSTRCPAVSSWISCFLLRFIKACVCRDRVDIVRNSCCSAPIIQLLCRALFCTAHPRLPPYYFQDEPSLASQAKALVDESVSANRAP